MRDNAPSRKRLEPKPIPGATLHRPVEGINLNPGSFGDQFQGVTLLVFLRHLG